MSATYSLRKMRKILHNAYDFYKKKGNSLPSSEQGTLSHYLRELNEALQQNNQEAADPLAKKLETFSKENFKKSPFEYFLELVLALIFALAIATLVRQTWFELYEIPTGSMRPTFLEQDHLTVSKTQFGINVPLQTAHFMFYPELVKRSGICIFSGDQLPLDDTDSTYFGIFPYKKRYVKRCMGKPEDTLYFYGGKIYGIDAQGNAIEENIKNPHLAQLEHIPFINFEGHTTATNRNEMIFSQMNMPIGKLKWSPQGGFQGEIYNGKEWVKDDPAAALASHNEIKTYSDIWGMGNFGMSRLLTKEEMTKDLHLDLKDSGEGVLYLEIRHHPSLTYPKPQIYNRGTSSMLLLNPQRSYIPLQKEHLDRLMDSMYTARFTVQNGKASRYSLHPTAGNSPSFPNVPDGTYEFYYGKAYSIGWGGISTLLPKEHPLYSRTPADIQKLYNLGINFDLAYAPRDMLQLHYPNRYAYFRDGDLYLLGAPVLKTEDPILQSFLAKEMEKEKQSTPQRPYLPFKNTPPPLKDGKIDAQFLKTFGLKIPPQQYLTLGDNHAMSADSRVFGFVPEANLQGVPELIIWPPGDRLGRPNQPPYPTFVTPRLIIWGIVLLIAAIWFYFHEKKLRSPIIV